MTATDAAKLDVEKILSNLTLEEKALLTSGVGFWNTAPIERLGVPSITLSDGPHGVRRAPQGDQIAIGESYPSTCFPPAVALGSSWDPELAETVGRALGEEANALDVQVLLGPGVNIKRSPLCGRNFEYFSEDPLVAGELGAALIRGVQSQGVGTSLKHFAANNQETDRLRVSADVDERTLREIYFPAFERVVKQAAPATVMCSYNRINGVYSSENHWLLTDVLRNEWGFGGLVVSDWGAVNERADGIRAGLDLEMPGTGNVGPDAVIAAVHDGSLDGDDLDAAVLALLRLVADHAAGIRPASAGEPALPADLAAEHHRLARSVAARCAVLLKNDNAILPLSRDASIAVIGEFARSPRYQGAGSSQIVTTELDDALSQLQRLSNGSVTFASGYALRDGRAATSSGQAPSSADGASARSEDESTATVLVDEAVAAAAGADVAVVFLGLPASAESEGFDRTHIDLPAEQLALLDAVAAANENVVVVLSNGSVVKISDWDARAHAILEGWLLGQAGGGAIADILFGIANPSGRLAETIPLRLEDNPSYLNFPGAASHVLYGEGVFVGYRWYDARHLQVSYPFGHGLSYTQFAYSDLVATVRAGDDGDDTAPLIDVSFTVTNTGGSAGHEVAQVYVQAPGTVIERPERELRAFRTLFLEPGASQSVTLTLSSRDVAYFDPALHEWAVESGTTSIRVGASSRDLRLSADVEIVAPQQVRALDRDSTLAEWMAHPRGSQLLGSALASGAGSSPLIDPETLMLIGSMPLKRVGRFPGVGLTAEMLDGLLAQANA